MKMFIAIVLCSGLVPYLTKGSETKDKLKRLIFKICIEIDIDCGHCADTIPNCADYTQAVCTDAAYSNWVEKNCKRFCNLCPKGSSGSVPQPVRRSTSTCSDKLADCSAYGTSSCTGQYVQWATENCAKTCNLCPSRSVSATGASSGGVPVPGTGSSGGSFSGSSTGCFYNSQIYREGTTWNDGCKYKCRCTDGMSGKYECKQLCINWDLPPTCTMIPPAPGRCCPTPSCPSNIIPQYPQGYEEK